jgi:POT family proton-dependent oligopeptide transporter
MGVMTVAGYLAAQSKVNIMWELGAYVLITMAELCISVIGLQLAFEEAPERMKSVITGVWLFTVFLGNILAAWFARVYTSMSPGNYFGIMTIMITIVTIIFYFIGRRFDHRAGNNTTASA